MPPKVQPIDVNYQASRTDSVKQPAVLLKSRLKRLFDRQFTSVLKSSSSSTVVTEKTTGPTTSIPATASSNVVEGAEFEPSSVCLAKMVQNFIEERDEKQSAKCGRNRCNCFNGNSNDSSDDEFDEFEGFNMESANAGSSGDSTDALKGLIPCPSVSERNLLADTAKIVEKNKNGKRKDDLRTIVVENLCLLRYDSRICKSKWEKTSSFPAGEYEYIDVIIEGGDRILIDVDFRSEFEIARSTSTYKAILNSLPYIFVGKTDRLSQIVNFISEAAKQSLKKKGMHFPPWRKAEYMRAKWLSPYTRESKAKSENQDDAVSETECGEFELIFGETVTEAETKSKTASLEERESEQGENVMMESFEVVVAVQSWQPPAIKPKSSGETGTKIVTGLASLLKEKP